jgi:hypothetical protein
VLAAVALLLLSACASGREGPPPPRREVNVFISPAGEPFRGGATGAYPIGAWFDRADANHDGALTLAEFQADAEAFFRRLDRNHDGVIDGAELDTYEQTIAPEILPRVARLTARDIPPLPDTNQGRSEERQREQGREPGRRRGGRDFGGGAGPFALTGEPEPVAAADTNFDGKVSLAEFLAVTQGRFERLDLDHDGRLTRSELPKTAAQRIAEREAAKGEGGEGGEERGGRRRR